MKAQKIKSPVNMKQYAALGSQIILNELILNALIGALAKIRPPIAQAFLLEIRGMIPQIDPEKFPGVRMRAADFAAAVEKTLKQKPQ
jgi:hypothetical protein